MNSPFVPRFQPNWSMAGVAVLWLSGFLQPFSSGHAALPVADPPIVLTGEVTAADKGTYQDHPFEVPAGVTRLDIEFTHSHKDAGTQLEVGLFDPERFRGTSRFSKERFHLAEHHATPSYLPGRMVPGTWRVSIGIPAVGAETRANWRVTVRLSRDRQAGLASPLKDGPAWYVGDFHAHTLHSDAFGCQDVPGVSPRRGCQPWEVVEAARARGLEFLAIADHNTTSHHADLATLQESLHDLLLLRGQELTTFRGHANVYGTSAFIDFRLGFKGRSMADVLDDVDRERALLSINHPGRETGDRCTGCGWDAPETPWERVRAMEIVNSTIVEGPEAGQPFWYARLNEGHRITGIGGSDDHAARSDRSQVGSPATVVFAAELSEPALLEGIRSGQVYVRTRGADGPTLDFSGTAAGRRVPMGGVLAVPGSGEVSLDVHATGASDQTLEILSNGVLVTTMPVRTADERLEHAMRLGPGDWVHVRLRDARGITAISNPIYVR
jgi:hypothetical protein